MPCLNILPCDGTARFMPDFIARPEADALLTRLQDAIPWREETLKIYGKTHLSPRLVCWFGDHAYRYSGAWHEPTPWLPALLDLKQRAEAASGTRFNSVLANLYRDGRDSMGWHADDERGLGQGEGENTIGSVSLGAARTFRLRHINRLSLQDETIDAEAARKTLRKYDLQFGISLTSGSLLVMDGAMQRHWQHAIPKTARPVGPRINLTFRWLKG